MKMSCKESTRRDFLKSAVLSGLGALVLPLSIPALASFTKNYNDFNRQYNFQGDLNIDFIPLPFDINGNLSFNGDEENYESRIECFRSGDDKPSYAIYSRCTLQNGVLIPKETITEIDVDLIWRFKRTKRLVYEEYENGLLINGKIEIYDSDENLERVSLKLRRHDSLGLDYISSVLRLMLDARNGFVPEEINLISGSGKMRSQEISFEGTQEGYRISAVYEDPSAKPKDKLKFSQRNGVKQSKNQYQKREASIVLDIDQEKELTHIVLSHEYGNIDVNLERVL